MSKLYSKLAQTYHEFYQSIFDYRSEFKLYCKILQKYGCKKVLEIGCGSGNLAWRFEEKRYAYVGLDQSPAMLKIAKTVSPYSSFVVGDMQDIKIKDRFDAVLITGRSFTAMTTNADVMKCLKSVNKVLKKNGILIFDNFDAEKIFSEFHTSFVQEADYRDTHYKRVSNNSINLEHGWTWNWNATYYISQKGKKTQIVKDKMILRAFTEDELRLFLKLNGFETLKVTKEGAALRVIARKNTLK